MDKEEASGFVYQGKDGVKRVKDKKFQANMFRLVKGRSLWHVRTVNGTADVSNLESQAVYSINTTRFSMGIAISHQLAMRILRQLKANQKM
eukprot:768025-Hanusia_phi.AAC.2